MKQAYITIPSSTLENLLNFNRLKIRITDVSMTDEGVRMILEGDRLPPVCQIADGKVIECVSLQYRRAEEGFALKNITHQPGKEIPNPENEHAEVVAAFSGE